MELFLARRSACLHQSAALGECTVNLIHARVLGLATGICNVSACPHEIIANAVFKRAIGPMIRGVVLQVLASEGYQELHNSHNQIPMNAVW